MTTLNDVRKPPIRDRVSETVRWSVARALGYVGSPRGGWKLAALLIAPALAARLFTSVYPFVQTAWLSLTNADGLNPGGHFIGLHNYVQAWHDPVVRQSLTFTVLFTAVSTVLELVLGFVLALLMNATFRLRGLGRAVALIPWAIPAIVAALGFHFMFSNGIGIIPDLLGPLGVHVDWLTDPFWARAAVVLTNVWRSMPFVALIILAGLQGIPQEVYQAARVDGAGYTRILRSIVVPLVTPLLLTMGVFMLIFQLGTFDVILGMTGGGPGTATQVLSYVAYKDAFIGQEYGRASALAMLLFFVVLLIGIFAVRLFRRTEVES